MELIFLYSCLLGRYVSVTITSSNVVRDCGIENGLLM
jgi:hypothetical protein